MARDWPCIACGKVGCCMDCVGRRELHWFQQRNFSHRKYTGRRQQMNFGRKCPVCGKELVPKRGEAVQNFNRRKHCSRECANISQRREPNLPEKECEWCGRDIIPVRRRGGRTPSPAEWAKRRFCSTQCRLDWMKDARKKKMFGVQLNDFQVA